MTPPLLEQLVLSKPYFDRHGLKLAFRNDVPVGFVHVGFGANETLNDIDKSIAVVCMLMVSKSSVPEEKARLQVAKELVAQAEEFAKKEGAKQIWGGSAYPRNPFYLGIYGGSRIPGVLDEDKFTVQVFQQLGYESIEEYGVWQSELAGFRTIVNREQMQLRRKFNVNAQFDPRTSNWWEACTLGHADRRKFELIERRTNLKIGEVNFWDMQPLASHWGVEASGMFDILIEEDQRRSGLGTFLVGEALRQLKEHGSTVAEVQTKTCDSVSIGLFEKLGFSQIDRGQLFSKDIAG